MHGLRHTYARSRYQELIDRGVPEFEAKKTVSSELGHNRWQVTLIYLGGAAS